MTEPTYSLGRLFAAMTVAAAGYVSGDYISILFGAVAGGLWPMSAAATRSRCEGALLMFKLVSAALVFTGLVAYLLERTQAIPATRALGPIAFLIAVAGNRWMGVVDSVFRAINTLIEASATGVARRISEILGGGKSK